MTQQQQSNTSPQDRQLPMQSLRKGSSSEPCNHVELFEVYEQLHSASDSVASAQVMFFWLSNLVWLHWVHPQILRQMPQTETPTTILFCFPTPQMAPNIQQYSNNLKHHRRGDSVAEPSRAFCGEPECPNIAGRKHPRK